MRLTIAVLAAGVLLAPAFAADDPPKGGGTAQMLLAKIDGDQLVTTSSNPPLARTLVVADGKTITVTETTTTSTTRELKYLRFSGPDDKEVPLADAKDRLKSRPDVVFTATPLDPSWKAKFKAGTLFVEYAAPREEKKDEKKEDKKPDDKKPDDKKDGK